MGSAAAWPEPCEDPVGAASDRGVVQNDVDLRLGDFRPGSTC
jgi:hypothetical protein